MSEEQSGEVVVEGSAPDVVVEATSGPVNLKQARAEIARLKEALETATTVQTGDGEVSRLTDEVVRLTGEMAALRSEARTFPMLNGVPITWKTAERIYAQYTKLFGSVQSLEQIAARGGFGWDEVKMFSDDYHKRFSA